MRRIKVGIIGCGHHTLENLLPPLVNVEKAICIWACDPDEAAAKAAAARFAGCVAFLEWQKAFELDRPDAVVVAASPQVHQDVLRTALAVGVPVFVEKPPTITRACLAELAELASSSGVITMVGHNLRHSDASHEMRRILSEASFGNPIAIQMLYAASKPIGDRWGLANPRRSFLLSHVSHALDFVIYHMGAIRRIVGALGRSYKEAITLSVELEFESGAIGSLLASNGAPHFDLSCTIMGSKRSIVSLSGLDRIVVFGGDNRSKRRGQCWVSPTLNTGHSFAGYQSELTLFLETVCYGPNSLGANPSLSEEVAVYDAIEHIERLLAFDGE
jgi:predicted dehydrogenase